MASEGENDMCWICLEEAAENGSHTLMSPCKCPRKVHPQCLARWQLQQAGRHEEKFCRFCNSELNDWKLHLTPEELKPEVNKVQPIMVVYFEGQIHRIPVKQGPDGLNEFTGKIRELFRLPEDVDISLTFGCKEPMSGSHLKLEGMGAFDAAVHCASVAAAERQQKIKKSYSTGNLGSSPAFAAGSDGPAMGRSASNNSIPAANLSASAAANAPSSAAGLSAANAAQDRRRRFQGEQGAATTGGQQQRGHAGRSRSFTVGSTPTGRSTGVEPPAAFRNILSMLGGSNSSNSVSPSSSTPFAAPAAQGSSAPEQGADGAAAAAQASSRGSSPAPAAVAPSGGVSAEQQRLKKGRLSLRNITELTDVPEIDETVAIGSFSGKFKLQLKAFSRKVARSFSFTNKGASLRGEAGSSGSAAAVAADGFGGFSSNSTSRAASMNSPRVINYGSERGAVSPSPRSMTSSPLPPPSPSIVRAAS